MASASAHPLRGALPVQGGAPRPPPAPCPAPAGGGGPAEEVAALLAPVLGWDATRQKEEVAAYEAQPRLATII